MPTQISLGYPNYKTELMDIWRNRRLLIIISFWLVVKVVYLFLLHKTNLLIYQKISRIRKTLNLSTNVDSITIDTKREKKTLWRDKINFFSGAVQKIHFWWVRQIFGGGSQLFCVFFAIKNFLEGGKKFFLDGLNFFLLLGGSLKNNFKRGEGGPMGGLELIMWLHGKWEA